MVPLPKGLLSALGGCYYKNIPYQKLPYGFLETCFIPVQHSDISLLSLLPHVTCAESKKLLVCLFTPPFSTVPALLHFLQHLTLEDKETWMALRTISPVALLCICLLFAWQTGNFSQGQLCTSSCVNLYSYCFRTKIKYSSVCFGTRIGRCIK